jgi:arginine utilization protein RocB
MISLKSKPLTPSCSDVMIIKHQKKLYKHHHFSHFISFFFNLLNMSSSVAEDQRKINENVNKAADQTKQELNKLRAEYEELKRSARPKVQEAENFLTSPAAIGFYQGNVL